MAQAIIVTHPEKETVITRYKKTGKKFKCAKRSMNDGNHYWIRQAVMPIVHY